MDTLIIHWNDGTIEARDYDREEEETAKMLNSRGEVKLVKVIDGEYNLKNMERNVITEVLRLTGYSQKQTAKILGISARVLNHKINKFGITHPSWLINK